MRVLKWGVPGTSQRSLQTVKQAGAEECSQPQWGAAGARPGIGGLPTARSKGLPIQPVTQNLSTEKDLSPVSVVVLICWNNRLKFENKTTLALAPCRSCNWRADPLREIAESFLRSESTHCIQDLPLKTSPCFWILLSATSSPFKSLCWWMPILLNTSHSLPLNTTTSLKVQGRSTTYQRWDAVLQRDRAVISWPTLSMSTGPSSPSPKAGLRRALMTCWWQCTALWRHSGESILSF